MTSRHHLSPAEHTQAAQTQTSQVDFGECEDCGSPLNEDGECLRDLAETETDDLAEAEYLRARAEDRVPQAAQTAEKKHDGGPAFPACNEANVNGTMGMSLRDRIALEALGGMLAHSARYRPRVGTSPNWHEAISEEAYQIADAMLAARAVQP